MRFQDLGLADNIATANVKFQEWNIRPKLVPKREQKTTLERGRSRSRAPDTGGKGSKSKSGKTPKKEDRKTTREEKEGKETQTQTHNTKAKERKGTRS